MSSLSQGLIIALSTVMIGSVLAWVVGTQVTYLWDDQKRRRESDLAALATFYRSYGDFFATWKLWSAHKDSKGTLRSADDLQWRLLERAELAESSFEALLVKLASERELSGVDKRMLGCFREAYQMLRERIEKDQALNWWASDIHGDEGFAQYHAYKALTEYVARLLAISPRRGLSRWLPLPATTEPKMRDAIATLAQITDRNKFKDQWCIIASKELLAT